VSSTREAQRPSPDALLREAAREGRGRLKVFLGAAPGVGKTYEMLGDGLARRKAGIDVVIGVVETHGRAETEALVDGYEIVPRREIEHQGRRLPEMDIDAILARRPALALVDELAHSNAPGSRHPKRYQDVEELLAAGIDVYSTVNIQHLESLNDVVASFTKVRVRETVPDKVLENAEIEVVDIPPDELIERLKEGKVYVPHEATRALSHFFSKSNLSALRELALRRAAQAVDAQMLEHLRAHALAGTWAGGERILVAVSELPGSQGLVRAAKRLADALRAPWTAIFVETPRAAQFGEAQRQQVAAVLQLAAQLGANVASIPAVNVIEGLKNYAIEARATQLVVGKSARSRWFELRHGSVVDRLVRETPGMAVHVLPMDERPEAPRLKAGAAAGAGAWGRPLGYLVSVLMVAGVTGLGVSIYALGNLTNLALLYLIPVMAAATLYGLRTGIAAGLLSALAYNFFFLPPLHTFTISDPSNIVTALMLLAVAAVTSQLAARVRLQADLAQRSAGQNAALAGFARQLTGLIDAEELGRTLCGEAGRLLGVQAVFLLPGEQGLALAAAVPPENRLDSIDMAAAGWAFDHGQPAGRGSETLTASDWLFQPLMVGKRALAIFGIARELDDPIRSDQLPLLLSLLDQAALALERISLEAEMAKVSQLKERDRLRAALLSSVSHDLRTPLTTILGSVAELRRSAGADKALVASIETEAQRLNRFVANLLDMARVEAGALKLALEPVDLTDAVTTAVHDLKQALAGHPIRLDVSPELPLVRVDPQLFHHCLINLLDNAGKYAEPGSPITVAARRRPDGLTLSVLDEGPGLPPGREINVFETFTRLEGSDRKGGTGLGLAIVKGFAEAMGLAVSASNRSEPRGACFSLLFPERLLVRGSTAA
ncbi:MAG: two-component system, OmpR family, sensor histidine kinase KdpD, partial [Sphingomonadales bacterium]|jgi:two-component system sensor histidine kinase KdpD|nr:two-component system, OmpR family, sensor histidine kinase KdpD [Sphingomonadales bacterium]